jgi:23S rRNA (pseudouridine1915-N3)-methyltransferase
MLRLKILSVGKTKESWLNQALEEYIKRLKPVLDIEFIWAKNDAQLLTLIEKKTSYICLDANGKQMDSPEFSQYVLTKFEESGTRLTFVIGGPEGLPLKLKNHRETISLSRLTMTHQIVRLVLLEQIYRAFEIAKGTPYHK